MKPRRLWLSLAMLVAGSALLAAAQLAGAVRGSAPLKKGGVFRVGTTGASVQVDPQLAYITTAWWLEYATAAKLYNYSPEGKLKPEVASRLVTSNEGRRYTFFIRKGFRFSDGTPVTASSFKYAFARASNPELGSPAAAFINDVIAVRAKGRTLIIDLRKADGSFISTLTMPFFQATSTKLPLNREVVSISSVTDMPSAGPYAYSRNDVNQLTSIRRNPFWTRGPGRNQPRNLVGLDVRWSLNEQTAFNQVKTGELDQGPLPAAEVQGVANQYGVNKTRFWAKPTNCVGSIVFNTQAGLFKGNAPMRKAVNWALDRTAYSNQVGPYAGRPWTHLIPPGFPGSITAKKLQPYAPRSNMAKARTLAAGHFKDGKITVYYRSSGTINPAQGELVRRTLVDLGFEAGNITMKGFAGGDIYTAIARRGTDADMGVSMGYCSDFPHDLYSFFAALLQNPISLPSRYSAKIAAAAALRGNARLKAFGKLDLEIMRNLAPVAVMRTYNNRFFFSDRVDPRGLRYHAVYSDFSIPALALK